MSTSRTIRITAILLVAAIVTALALPATALAAVGEPVEGAEVFLSEQPGDDPIVITPTASGHETNAECSISWPDGAVASSTDITVTVGYSEVGERATDGGVVKRIARLQPDGQTFLVPITLQMTAPVGLRNPRAYVKDPSTGAWQRVASSKNGDKVTTDIKHFSLYGIGGDEPQPVPASSTWSVWLLGVFGIALLVAIARRRAIA